MISPIYNIYTNDIHLKQQVYFLELLYIIS